MEAAVRAAVPAQCTLRSDADALALAVHAALEVDGLRCVASSEEEAKASRGEPPASPLPADWNDGGDVYCLYYKHAAGPGTLFTVKSVVMDELLLVHSASDQTADVHCLELRTGDFVQCVPPNANAAALDFAKVYSDLDAPTFFRSKL